MSANSTEQIAGAGEAREHPAGNGVVVLLVVTALLVLTQLYAAIPLIAPIGAELGSDVTFALSTVFSVCYAVGFLIWGPLADQYGRKRIMLIGLVYLTVATIACGFASTVPMLAALRGVQGVMASSFAPVALAYLAEATPLKRRATAIGAMSTAFLVAGIAGQVLASALSLTLGWQWVFILSGIMLGLGMIGVAVLVTEPHSRRDDASLVRRFAVVGRVATRPSVLLLSLAHLILQRQLIRWWSFSTAAVVAGPGLVLSAAAPDRPADRAGHAGDRGEDEGGEETADLVAAQRDQPGFAGWRSPFSASRARVADR